MTLSQALCAMASGMPWLLTGIGLGVLIARGKIFGERGMWK